MNQTSLSVGLAGLGFMLTVIWGGPFTRILRMLGLTEKIRLLSPHADITRAGTPLMGGILIVAPVFLMTVMLNAASLVGLPRVSRAIFAPVIVMIVFAGIGFFSDWLILRQPERKTLRSAAVLVFQFLFALVTVIFLWAVFTLPDMYFPLYKGEFEMHFWYLPAAIIVLLLTVKTVDLTSSVNGLTGMVTATAFAGYGAVALLQEQPFLSFFCFTVVGSVLGFLWFNIKPAALFLGHTGTFALGASLGTVALMTAQWPLLPFFAFVPFLEGASIVVQFIQRLLVGSQRAFRVVPIHHHFEMVGWSETQILQRLWLINLLFTMIGVTLAML